MIGYWLQPADVKTTMLVEGELPKGILPSALALATFILIFAWVVSSCFYLVATLRRLRAYRAELKSLYSNLDKRELRWVDWFIVALATLWAATAMTFVAENTGFGQIPTKELIYGLTACLMLFIIAFASITPLGTVPDEAEIPGAKSNEKYARSALSAVHARQLATRIKSAMTQDALLLSREANTVLSSFLYLFR